MAFCSHRPRPVPVVFPPGRPPRRRVRPRVSSVSSSGRFSPPADAPSPVGCAPPASRTTSGPPTPPSPPSPSEPTSWPPGWPTRPSSRCWTGTDRLTLRHRRHADPTLRATRRGGRRPPQPHAGAGRARLRLRPRLGRTRLAGPPPRLGHHRPAAAGPPLRPPQEPAPRRRPTTGRPSAPSWSWPSNWCTGPCPGWASSASPCGSWPTAPTPRLCLPKTSSSGLIRRQKRSSMRGASRRQTRGFADPFPSGW